MSPQKTPFPVWKTITVDAHAVSRYVQSVHDPQQEKVPEHYFGPEALHLIHDWGYLPRMRLSLTKVSGHIILATPGIKGIVDLYRFASLKGLIMCPAQVGPALRLHDRRQLERTTIIAMHPRVGIRGQHAVFQLYGDYPSTLTTTRVSRNGGDLYTTDEVVFVHPRTPVGSEDL